MAKPQAAAIMMVSTELRGAVSSEPRKMRVKLSAGEMSGVQLCKMTPALFRWFSDGTIWRQEHQVQCHSLLKSSHSVSTVALKVHALQATRFSWFYASNSLVRQKSANLLR